MTSMQPDQTPPVVELTVRLAPSVAELLTELATMDGLSLTNGVREAVICYHDARRGPHPDVRHAAGVRTWTPPGWVPRGPLEALRADFAEQSCTAVDPGDPLAEALDAAYADAAEHLGKVLDAHPGADNPLRAHADAVVVDRVNLPPVTVTLDGDYLVQVGDAAVPVAGVTPDERLLVDVLAQVAVLEHARTGDVARTWSTNAGDDRTRVEVPIRSYADAVVIDRAALPAVTLGAHGDFVMVVRGNHIPVDMETTRADLRASVLARLAVLEHRRANPPVIVGRPVPPWYPAALQRGAPVADVQDTAVRYYEATLKMSAEIEDTLAPALGFEPYPPGSPGYSPDQVNYVTGDHTAESLALLAARRLRAVSEVLANGRHDDACAMAKPSAGEVCSCWMADLGRALRAGS